MGFVQHQAGVAHHIPALVTQLAARHLVRNRAHLADQADQGEAVRGDLFFFQALENFFRAQPAHQPENRNNHPLSVTSQRIELHQALNTSRPQQVPQGFPTAVFVQLRIAQTRLFKVLGNLINSVKIFVGRHAMRGGCQTIGNMGVIPSAKCLVEQRPCHALYYTLHKVLGLQACDTLQQLRGSRQLNDL